MFGDDRFVFLNAEGRLTGPADWNAPSSSKLWLYNLHYFDDLNATGADGRRDWHRALIQRWVDENPPVAGNGWEPYPISLRVVNWIKWALRGNELEPAWVDSLASQMRFLRKRLEYHLLGNHLLANAKALVFAGLYFSGDEAAEWLGKGTAILQREVPEQVLPDGGHFERSPMYHAIVLEVLLDLVNVFGVYGLRSQGHQKEAPTNVIPASAEVTDNRAGMTELLADTAVTMLAWLRYMTHPDGGIGFFNDAAHGIAPTAVELERYAERLGLPLPPAESRALLSLPDSGFVRVRRGAALALLDVGEIGPGYLPGHAHADTLSFELSLFGQRCVVNAGVSCYGDSDERLQQRGTAAHSTVEIDGVDSSEVWGGFRVARRARPFGLETRQTEQVIAAKCAHDGYRRLSGKPVHRRQWRFEPGKLRVTDIVSGGFEQAVAYYHLHPDVDVYADKGAGKGRLELGGVAAGRHANWSVTGGEVSIAASTYHPEFGLDIPNQVIEVVFAGAEAVFTLQWGEE